MKKILLLFVFLLNCGIYDCIASTNGCLINVEALYDYYLAENSPTEKLVKQYELELKQNYKSLSEYEIGAISNELRASVENVRDDVLLNIIKITDVEVQKEIIDNRIVNQYSKFVAKQSEALNQRFFKENIQTESSIVLDDGVLKAEQIYDLQKRGDNPFDNFKQVIFDKKVADGLNNPKKYGNIKSKVIKALNNGLVSGKGQMGIKALEGPGDFYEVKILGIGGDMRVKGKVDDTGILRLIEVTDHKGI